MDFLEIRRKAKERAAAREAAKAGAARESPADPAPAPLRLDPLPPPPPEAPTQLDVPLLEEPALVEPLLEELRHEAPVPPERVEPAAWAPPVQGPPTVPPRKPHPPIGSEEAAALEAALVARIENFPLAQDGRFRTWRPDAGTVPDVAPITGDAGEGEAAAAPSPAAAPGVAAGRRRAAPGDPLDDFFYRDDELGPDLGDLPSTAEFHLNELDVEDRVEYLTFLLGAEEYGVEIDRVREVMRSPPVTEVPRAPVDVLGVITVRGEVVAVFDPRGRLGLPVVGDSGGGRVIIVDDGLGPCGLLVDAVASVVRLPPGNIEQRPQGMGGLASDCLAGIGRDHERLFTILDVTALLRGTRRAGEGRA